jgi:hypothetical protein
LEGKFTSSSKTAEFFGGDFTSENVKSEIPQTAKGKVTFHCRYTYVALLGNESVS